MFYIWKVNDQGTDGNNLKAEPMIFFPNEKNITSSHSLSIHINMDLRSKVSKIPGFCQCTYLSYNIISRSNDAMWFIERLFLRCEVDNAANSLFLIVSRVGS